MLARIQGRNAEPRVLGGAGHLNSWALCRASGEGLQWNMQLRCEVGHRIPPCRPLGVFLRSLLITCISLHAPTYQWLSPLCWATALPLSSHSPLLAAHLKHLLHSSWYDGQLFIIFHWVLSFLRSGTTSYSSLAFESWGSECFIRICWINELRNRWTSQLLVHLWTIYYNRVLAE